MGPYQLPTSFHLTSTSTSYESLERYVRVVRVVRVGHFAPGTNLMFTYKLIKQPSCKIHTHTHTHTYTHTHAHTHTHSSLSNACFSSSSFPPKNHSACFLAHSVRAVLTSGLASSNSRHSSRVGKLSALPYVG